MRLPFPWLPPPSSNDRGRKADKYSITEDLTYYNAEAPHPGTDGALPRFIGNIREWLVENGLNLSVGLTPASSSSRGALGIA